MQSRELACMLMCASIRRCASGDWFLPCMLAGGLPSRSGHMMRLSFMTESTLKGRGHRMLPCLAIPLKNVFM